MPSNTISHNLDSQTRPSDLVKKLDGENLLCTACGHLCKLKPGQRGICKVRFNSEGTLMVPFRYSAGLQNDPIEKNLSSIWDDDEALTYIFTSFHIFRLIVRGGSGQN